MKGIIYILSNPCMPNIIKIGRTNQEDVKMRMAQLYTTGVPVPFQCEYAAVVKDMDRVERALHIAFGPNRLNPKREFFEIDALQAIAIIKLLEIEDVSPQVGRQAEQIDAVEVEAGKAFAQKRPRLNFFEMGIPAGSMLSFVETGETALVHSPRSVIFRDEETSLTNATKIAGGDRFAYSVAPGPYWTFEGRRLRDIYDETYSRDI